MNEKKITYITTCKGRVEHLKQTLPIVCQQKSVNVIMVDYSCPQHSGEWVRKNFPDVKVVSVEGEAQYSFGRSRNLGAAAATTEWLAFFDADVIVAPDFFERVASLLQPGGFYTSDGINGNEWGSVFVAANDFKRAGGYDEAIGHWGGNDVALYNALRFLGMERRYFSSDLISAIKHSHEARFEHSTLKDVVFAQQMSSAYEVCKLELAKMQGRLLTLVERQSLRKSVGAAIQAAKAGQKGEIQVDIGVIETKRRNLKPEENPLVKRRIVLEISLGYLPTGATS